jgi:hypothetical protein
MEGRAHDARLYSRFCALLRDSLRGFRRRLFLDDDFQRRTLLDGYWSQHRMFLDGGGSFRRKMHWVDRDGYDPHTMSLGDAVEDALQHKTRRIHAQNEEL